MCRLVFIFMSRRVDDLYSYADTAFDKDSLEYADELLRGYCERFPNIRQLSYILTGEGGKHISINPQDVDYWIEKYLANGQFIYPREVSFNVTRTCRLKPLECFQNLLSTYPRHYNTTNPSVYVGFSLMERYNTWIQHVWVYDGHTLFETTPIRSTKYFGVETSILEFRQWMDDYRWRLPQMYTDF